MPLSCSCPDWDDAPWYYEHTPADYSELNTSRRKRCCSCGTLIDLGAVTLKFPRFRYSNTEIEIKIFGEEGEISLATHYQCERCADLFYSLEALGFCVSPGENMLELAQDYAAIYGPQAQKSGGN